MKESNYTHVIHPFPALYDADSKILILGSLPSVKSREQNFFYGHPQNRFWKMLARSWERRFLRPSKKRRNFCIGITLPCGIRSTVATSSVQATAVLKM